MGTQLLPTHTGGVPSKAKGRSRADSLALADVWDEREEIFDIGDGEDSDTEGPSRGTVKPNGKIGS